MTEEQRKALMNLKKYFKTTTATELNIKVDKLAMIIRKESNKEVVDKKFKSEFTDE
jgi:hypothetical protein